MTVIAQAEPEALWTYILYTSHFYFCFWYSHRYTVDKKQKLKMSKLLFVYGIAVTILVYGYTRTKSRN